MAKDINKKSYPEETLLKLEIFEECFREWLPVFLYSPQIATIYIFDFFAGSGTTGAAALELGRRFILVDNNLEALAVMAQRFDGVADIAWNGFDPAPYQSRTSPHQH